MSGIRYGNGHRLCDGGNRQCRQRWGACSEHAPLSAVREGHVIDLNLEWEGRKCCGYQIHAPSCPTLAKKAKPAEQKCPTCGYSSTLVHGFTARDCSAIKPGEPELSTQHTAHRAAWLAQQKPAARAGWHVAENGMLKRDDRRATAGQLMSGWCVAWDTCSPPTGRVECETAFLTAEAAMDHADAQLAAEDARKQAGALPADWTLRPTFKFTYDHESGASVSRSIGVEGEWHARRADGRMVQQTLCTREEAMRLATADLSATPHT